MGMEQSEQMVLTDMLEMFQSMLLPLVGISLVGIAASIILAFCVYYDAPGGTIWRCCGRYCPAFSRSRRWCM